MTTLQRSTVALEAATWLKTPYHHHGRVKGVGVDCAQFLCAVYEAAGVIGKVDPGFYAHDWHLHHGEEQFLAWIERSGGRRVEVPQRGDVAVFRFGRTFSHGAIMLTADTAIHSYIEMGVVITRLDEQPLAGRPVQFWSLWQ